MNKRVGFFVIAAVLCFSLVPVLAEKFQWVPKLAGSLYLGLAVLAAADLLSRRRL